MTTNDTNNALALDLFGLPHEIRDDIQDLIFAAGGPATKLEGKDGRTIADVKHAVAGRLSNVSR